MTDHIDRQDGDMNWGDYVTEARKTVPDQSRVEELVQAALGLTGGLAELCEAAGQSQIVDELGDCQWYLALASSCGTNWLDQEPRWGVSDSGWGGLGCYRSPASSAAELCGWIENLRFQKDDPFIEINRCLAHIAHCLDRDRQTRTDATRAKVWRRNLSKLNGRHGDSWSPAKEQNRD